MIRELQSLIDRLTGRTPNGPPRTVIIVDVTGVAWTEQDRQQRAARERASEADAFNRRTPKNF